MHLDNSNIPITCSLESPIVLDGEGCAYFYKIYPCSLDKYNVLLSYSVRSPRVLDGERIGQQIAKPDLYCFAYIELKACSFYKFSY